MKYWFVTLSMVILILWAITDSQNNKIVNLRLNYEKEKSDYIVELNTHKAALKVYEDWFDPIEKEYINPIHFEDYDELTSAKGYRILHNPFTGGNEDSDHSGVDLVGTWHARVVSIADGKVIDNYYPPGKGWKGHPVLGGMIRIQHDDGRISVYGHLSSTYVNETTKRFVKKGQVIGRTGDTGMAYGEHLHYELWENGKLLNPLQYIDVTK